mgnify:CR=1 FL=1
MYEYYYDKNVLITGGAGFIGSELCSQISKVCKKLIIIDNLVNGKFSNVKNILNNNIIFYDLDIRDSVKIEKIIKDIDIVFHLACLGVRHSIHSPFENHEVNASATLNLLKTSYLNKVKKFIYISTSEVYGNNITPPISEKHPTFPATVYGSSKLAAEAYARSYWNTYNFPVVIIRPFNSYGPNSHHEGDSGEVIPKFILRCILDEPMIIHGDGKQTRDFTFIDDAIKRTFDIAEKINKGSEIFNICGDNEYTIKNVATKIKNLCNSSSKITTQEVPSNRNEFEVQRRTGSSKKINQFIGDYKYIDLSIGLKLIKDYLER